jgi:rare lipoprotein A
MVVFVLATVAGFAGETPANGIASWYGESHRGRLMANGKPFNPDRLTAASWFYPLGTRVRVTVDVAGLRGRTVVVTITDRGPARELVLGGRVIDLAQAAFARLGDCSVGLLPVSIGPEPLRRLAERAAENPVQASVEQPGPHCKIQHSKPTPNEIRLPVSLPKTAS